MNPVPEPITTGELERSSGTGRQPHRAETLAPLSRPPGQPTPHCRRRQCRGAASVARSPPRPFIHGPGGTTSRVSSAHNIPHSCRARGLTQDNILFCQQIARSPRLAQGHAACRRKAVTWAALARRVQGSNSAVTSYSAAVVVVRQHCRNDERPAGEPSAWRYWVGWLTRLHVALAAPPPSYSWPPRRCGVRRRPALGTATASPVPGHGASTHRVTDTPDRLNTSNAF